MESEKPQRQTEASIEAESRFHQRWNSAGVWSSIFFAQSSRLKGGESVGRKGGLSAFCIASDGIDAVWRGFPVCEGVAPPPGWKSSLRRKLWGKIIRRSGFVARVDHSCWILRRRRVKRQFKSEDECTGAFDTGGGGGMLAVQFEKECVTKPCLRKFPTDSPGSFVPTLVSLFDFEVCRGRWTDEWSLFDGRNYVMQYVIRAQHSPLHVRSFETLIRLQGIEKKRRNKSTRGVKTIRIFRRKFDE